jgi:glycosyltransferase involved in cell wall biosynthesis
VSASTQDSMIAACDCYVSLHRSEGYGLTMAEAMAHGKPVIATGYSGNLEFMNEQNSYLVPFRPIRLAEQCGPYAAGEEWAEPDIDAAAELMRYVYENREEARARGSAARETLAAEYTIERTAAFISTRIGVIRKERRHDAA